MSKNISNIDMCSFSCSNNIQLTSAVFITFAIIYLG